MNKVAASFRYNEDSLEAAKYNSDLLDQIAEHLRLANPRNPAAIAADAGQVFLSRTFELPHQVSLDTPQTRWSAAQSFQSQGYGPEMIGYLFTLGSSRLQDKVAFHCRINAVIDCNHVPGLGGVWTNMAQEHSGIDQATIMNWGSSAITFEAYQHCTPQNWTLNDIHAFPSSTAKDRTFVQINGNANQGRITKASLTTGALGQRQACGLLANASRVVVEGLHVENLDSGVIFTNGASGSVRDSEGLGGTIGKGLVETLVRIRAGAGAAIVVDNCRRFGAVNLVVDERLGLRITEDLARYTSGETASFVERADRLYAGNPDNSALDIVAAGQQRADLIRFLKPDGTVMSAIDASGRFRINRALDERSTEIESWSPARGIADRSPFDTRSANVAQLAERLKALIDDLLAAGVIE
ncbi:hypothetical protein DM450_25455 (plasmid) [Sphingomonas sp. IC081]|nr:hypothetical protein DM450_25455 [Sphingomonas sp. IC081]